MAQQKDPIVVKMREDFDNALKSNPSDDLKRLAEKIKPHLEWIEIKSLEVRYQPRPHYDRYEESRDIINDLISAVMQIANAEIVGIDVKEYLELVNAYYTENTIVNLSFLRDVNIDCISKKRNTILVISNQIKEKVRDKKNIEFEKQAEAFLKLAEVCYALFSAEEVNIALYEESKKNRHTGYDDFKSRMALKIEECTKSSDKVFRDREKAAKRLQEKLSKFIESELPDMGEVFDMMKNIEIIIKYYPKSDYNDVFTPVYLTKLKKVYSECLQFKTALYKISAATLNDISNGSLKEEIKIVLETDVDKLKEDIQKLTDKNSNIYKEYIIVRSNTLDKDDSIGKEKYEKTKKSVERWLNKTKRNVEGLSQSDPEFKEFDKEADEYIKEFIEISKKEKDVLYVALDKKLTEFNDNKIKPLCQKISNKICANVAKNEYKTNKEEAINNFSEKSFEPLFENPSEETKKALSELKEKHQLLLEFLKTSQDKNQKEQDILSVLQQVTDINRKDKNLLFIQQFNAAKKIWQSVFELIPKHKRKESTYANYDDYNHAYHRVKIWQSCEAIEELKERWSNIKKCIEEVLGELKLPDRMAEYLYKSSGNSALFKENIHIMEFLAQQDQTELTKYFSSTELDEIQKLYQPYEELKKVVNKIESLDYSSGINDSLTHLDANLKEFKTKIKSISKDNIWGSGVSAVSGKYKQKYHKYLAAVKDREQKFDELYVSLNTKIKTIETRISSILAFMPDLKRYQETLEGVKKYIGELNQNKSQNYLNNLTMLKAQNEAVKTLETELEKLVKENIFSRAEEINKRFSEIKEADSAPELILISQQIKLINQWLQPSSLINGVLSVANTLTKDERSKKLIQLERVEIPKDEKIIKSIFDSLKDIEDELGKFEIEAQKNKYTLLIKKLKEISTQNPLPIQESGQVDKRITSFKSKVLDAIKNQLEKNLAVTADLNEWRKYSNIADKLTLLFETAELFEKDYQDQYQKISKLSMLEKYFDNEFILTDEFKQIRAVSIANFLGKRNYLTLLGEWCEGDLNNDNSAILKNSDTFKAQGAVKWKFNFVQGKGWSNLDQAYNNASLISRTKLSAFLTGWQNFTIQIRNNADFSTKLLALKQKFPENFFEFNVEDLKGEKLFKPYQELTPELEEEFNKLKEDYNSFIKNSAQIENAQKNVEREKSKNAGQLLEQKELREKIHLVNKLVTDIKEAEILDVKKISELDDVRREINSLLGQSEGLKIPKMTASELKIISCHDEKLYAISGIDQIESVNQKLIGYQAALEGIIQTEKSKLAKTITDLREKLSKFPTQDNPVRANVATEINKYIEELASRFDKIELSEILKVELECRSALALMKFVELWEEKRDKISQEFYQADVIFEFLAEEYEKPQPNAGYYTLKNKFNDFGLFYEELKKPIDFSIDRFSFKSVKEFSTSILLDDSSMVISNRKTMQEEIKISNIFVDLKANVYKALQLFNHDWKKIDGEKHKTELDGLKAKIPDKYQKCFLLDIKDDTPDTELFDSYRAMLAIKDEFDKFQSNIHEKQKQIEIKNQSDKIKSDQAPLREVINKINTAVNKILVEKIVVKNNELDQCDDSRRKLNDMLGQSEGVKLLSASKLVVIANCLDAVPYPIELKKNTLESIVSQANIYLGKLQALIQQHEAEQAKTERDKQEALRDAKENYQTALKNKTDALLKIKDKSQFAGFVLGKEFALDNKSTAEIITETQSLKETINRFNQAFSQYELLESFGHSDIVLKNMQELTANIALRVSHLISDKKTILDNLGKLKTGYEKIQTELNSYKSQIAALESRYLPLENIAVPDVGLLKIIEEKLKAIALSQQYFNALNNEHSENWGATVFQAEKKKVEDIDKQHQEMAKKLPEIKKSVTDYLELYKQNENQIKEKEKEEAARKARETLITQLNSAKSNYETAYKNLENLKQQCDAHDELKGVSLGNNPLIPSLEITDKISHQEIFKKIEAYQVGQDLLSKVYQQQKELFNFYIRLSDAQHKLELETGKTLDKAFGVGQLLEAVVKKKQEIFYKAIADIQQKLKTADAKTAEQAKKLGDYVKQLKEKFESGRIEDKKNINARDEFVTSANNTRNMIQAWESNLVKITRPAGVNPQKLTEQVLPTDFSGLGEVLSLIGEKASEKLPQNTLSTDQIIVEAEKTELQVIRIDYNKLEEIESVLLSPSEVPPQNQEKQSTEIKKLPELKTAVSTKKSQVKQQIEKINGQVQNLKKDFEQQEAEFTKVKKAQEDFQALEKAREEQRRKDSKPRYVDKAGSKTPEAPNFQPLEKNLAEVKKKIGEWETKFSVLSSTDPLEWKEESLQEAAKSKSEIEAKLEAEKNRPEQKLSVQITKASTAHQEYKARVTYWQLKEETEDKLQEYEVVLGKVQDREENYNSYYQDEIASAKKSIVKLQRFQKISSEEKSVESLRKLQGEFKNAIENFEKNELVTVKAVDTAQLAYLQKAEKLLALPPKKEQGKNISQKAYAEKMKKLAEKKQQQPAVSESVKKADKKIEENIQTEQVERGNLPPEKQPENNVKPKELEKNGPEKTVKKEEPKNTVSENKEKIDSKSKKGEKKKNKKAKGEKKGKKSVVINAPLNLPKQPAVPVPLVINQPMISAVSPQVVAEPAKPIVSNAVESKVYAKTAKEYLQKNFVALTMTPQTEAIYTYTYAEVCKQVEKRQVEFQQKVVLNKAIPDEEMGVYNDFYISQAKSILPKLERKHWLADFLQNSPKARGFFGLFSDDFSDPNWINQNCSYEFKTGKEKEQLGKELKDLEGRVPRLVQYFETIMFLENTRSLFTPIELAGYKNKSTEILNNSTKNTEYNYQQAFENLRGEVSEKAVAIADSKSAQRSSAQSKSYVVAPYVPNSNRAAIAMSQHGNFAVSQQAVKLLSQSEAVHQLELLNHNYNEFRNFCEKNTRAWVLDKYSQDIPAKCYQKINKNLTAIDRMLDELLKTKNASGQDFNQIFFEFVFDGDKVHRMEKRVKSKEKFPNPKDTKSVSEWMQVFKSDLVGQNQYSVYSMMNKHMTGVKAPTWSDSVLPRKNNAM